MARVIRSGIVCVTMLSLAAALAAQAPVRIQHIVLPARGEAVAVVVPVGFEHDPPGESGIAEACARLLLATAAAELPEGASAGHQVAATLTVFVATGEAADGPRLLGWARTLLREVPPGDALAGDRLALARARAALWADDCEHVLPGPLLSGRLLRQALAGTPGARPFAGDAAQILAVTPERLRARIGQAHGPAGATVVALGGSAAELLQPVTAAIAALPARGVAGPAVREMAGVATAEPTPHGRIDGPYAAIAVRAPSPAAPGALAFALAAEVLRTRALRHWPKVRGGEARARTPAVAFDLLAGDPLLIVFRRGADWAPFRQPADEIGALLQDAATVPPAERELASARAALGAEWARHPFPALLERTLAAEPAALGARARVEALALHWRLPADLGAAVRAVPDAAVATALREAFGRPPAASAGLVPSVPPPPDVRAGR